MKSLALVFVALVGCAGNQAHPSLSASVIGEPREHVVQVGHPILVSGDWGMDDCHRYHAGPNLLEQMLGDKSPSYWNTSCHHQVPYHVTLTCSAPCNIWNDATVTPTKAGPLTVYATIERDDTHDRSHASFDYVAVAH
jgi:hypothetical protein